MKDAARLFAYGLATLLFGALCAPLLYWTVEWLNARGLLLFLAQFDFESFFHRTLLLGALIFLWPLLRALGIRRWRDLGLTRNPHALRDAAVGAATAAIPLLCFGAVLVMLGIWSWRPSIAIPSVLERTVTAIVVPFLEEPIFRGLLLGVFLRSCSATLALFLTSALFSVLHFLKAPENTSAVVTWSSGFTSIANAFSQFNQPLLLLAGLSTLFLLGWILGDARLRTRSLWLPLGLHGGWIFANGLFNRIARREMEALPWIGKNLLIGIAPLCVALLTWALICAWLRYVESAKP